MLLPSFRASKRICMRLYILSSGLPNWSMRVGSLDLVASQDVAQQMGYFYLAIVSILDAVVVHAYPHCSVRCSEVCAVD